MEDLDGMITYLNEKRLELELDLEQAEEQAENSNKRASCIQNQIKSLKHVLQIVQEDY